MPERFECTTLAKKALYKYSSFPFLSFPFGGVVISFHRRFGQSVSSYTS